MLPAAAHCVEVATNWPVLSDTAVAQCLQVATSSPVLSNNCDKLRHAEHVLDSDIITRLRNRRVAYHLGPKKINTS